MKTLYVCEKCGVVAELESAMRAGWLIGRRKGGRPGQLVIRCPSHITAYARRLIERRAQ